MPRVAFTSNLQRHVSARRSTSPARRCARCSSRCSRPTRGCAAVHPRRPGPRARARGDLRRRRGLAIATGSAIRSARRTRCSCSRPCRAVEGDRRMSDRLLVATRKGLFELRRGAQGWATGGPSFLGSPVSHGAAPIRATARSTPRSTSAISASSCTAPTTAARRWKEIAAPAYPEAVGAEDEPRQRVKLIWALEARRRRRARACSGPAPSPAACSAATTAARAGRWSRPVGPAATRKSGSAAATTSPGIHSICVDPRDRARVAVAVSTGGVWDTRRRRRDLARRRRGAARRVHAAGARDDPMHPGPAPHGAAARPRRTRCGSSTTTASSARPTAARRWQEMHRVRPSSFGFAVAVHPREPDTAWFVPAVKDECRDPGRRQAGGHPHARRRRELRGAARGPAASATPTTWSTATAWTSTTTGERLAMGSTTGHLWISEDAGDALDAGRRQPAADRLRAVRLARHLPPHALRARRPSSFEPSLGDTWPARRPSSMRRAQAERSEAGVVPCTAAGFRRPPARPAASPRELQRGRAVDECVPQPRGDDERVARRERMPALLVGLERGRAREHEAERELGVMRRRRGRRARRAAAPRARPRGPPVAVPIPVSRHAKPGARHGTQGAPPRRRGARKAARRTPARAHAAVGSAMRGRRPSRGGRAADLDHLEFRRALEHAVADARRLQHAVARPHRERLALVLVDDAHPAGRQ